MWLVYGSECLKHPLLKSHNTFTEKRRGVTGPEVDPSKFSDLHWSYWFPTLVDLRRNICTDQGPDPSELSTWSVTLTTNLLEYAVEVHRTRRKVVPQSPDVLTYKVVTGSKSSILYCTKEIKDNKLLQCLSHFKFLYLVSSRVETPLLFLKHRYKILTMWKVPSVSKFVFLIHRSAYERVNPVFTNLEWFWIYFMVSINITYLHLQI